MFFFSTQAMKIIYAKKNKQLSPLFQGFTLTELLVALVITSVLVTGATIGLQTLLQASSRSEQESQARYQMNRALDYITEDIRTADQLWDDAGASDEDYQDSSGNEWSKESEWLNSSSHNPVLYIRSPLRVEGIDSDIISVSDHGFLNGNAVMFRGSGVSDLTNITEERIYYVCKPAPPNKLPNEDNEFKVTASATAADTCNGSAISLDTTTDSVTAYRLLVYYTRDNTSTWYSPNTLNRSAGICSHSPKTNCPMLIDAVENFERIPSSSNNRKVDLRLTRRLNPRDVKNGASPKLETLNIEGFARSN